MEPIKTTSSSSYKRIGTIALSVIVVFSLLYIYIYNASKNKTPKNGTSNEERVNAYRMSLLSNEPAALQENFVKDVKLGVNDMYTKSDVYFITHRFFDNNGNIYEIYDFIELHPELAFLKEAETIYPGVFEKIKNRTLSSIATDSGYYAYLAYVEILMKYGYTDIAAVGTAAGQYAKLAYVTTEIAKEMPKNEGVERSKYAKRNIKKSADFLVFATKDVERILNGELTSKDIIPQDILVGLNQYAAALRYREALGFKHFSPKMVESLNKIGVKASSIKTPEQIFAFTTEYSHRFVPELNLFTSLLNASTLAILASSTPQDIKVALYPLLDFDTKNTRNANFLKIGIIPKILDSRFEKKPDNIGETAMDIYSKRNTLRLANKVPEFKAWLMLNGWVEADFK